jgi:hypothetical protein
MLVLEDHFTIVERLAEDNSPSTSVVDPNPK